MRTFESPESIEKARLPPEHKRLMAERFRAYLSEIARLGEIYDPLADGRFAYIDKNSRKEDFLACVKAPSLDGVTLEHVGHITEASCFMAVWIPNNSFALSIFIPDQGLDAVFRQWLMDQVEDITP